MRRNFSLAILFMASLFILSAQAFSQVRRPQPTIRVNERIQQTVVRNSRIDLAEWLRVARSDARRTEILNITVSGQSFVTGELEIKARGRLIARMAFNRQLVTRSFDLPVGTLVSDVEFAVRGEVFVERIGAIITDLRVGPTPPRQPAPAPIPPQPPRQPAPAPAPKPQPPRHEPAPAPKPGQPAPKPGQPAPKPGQPAPRR